MRPPSRSSIENLRDNFRTNVEGAIHTVQHLLPLLKQGNAKQIFFISSICGSMQGFYSETAAGVTCESRAPAHAKVPEHLTEPDTPFIQTRCPR